MFDLKCRAFIRLGENRMSACMYACFASYCSICANISFLIAGISFFHSIRIVLRQLPVIGRLWHAESGILPALLFLLIGGAYSICRHCFSFALYAALSNQEETDNSYHADLLSVWNGIRFLLLRFEKSIRSIKIWMICMLPAIFTITVLCFLLAAGIVTVLFILGIGILALQIISGSVAASIMQQRYAVASYLLCTNPLLPVSESLSSSALLTENKIMRITSIRLLSLPFHFSVNLFLPLINAHMYRIAVNAVLSEQIYDEQKTAN